MLDSALDIVNGETERELGVAVDSDVEEVGDGDGLGGGEAEKKGGGEELHFCGWKIALKRGFWLLM